MKIVMSDKVAPERMPKAREHFPAHVARLDEVRQRGKPQMAVPCTPFVTNDVMAQWSLRECNEVLA